MGQVTCDMWHVTGGERWFFSQNFSSQALLAWEWRFVESLKEKADSLTQLMSDQGACRTASATLGLLIRPLKKITKMMIESLLHVK